MYPVLSNGDLVLYRPLKESEHPVIEGSIVVAKHPFISSKLIIKRIQRIENNGYFLIGENNEISSDSRQFGVINHKKVIGIIENKIDCNGLNFLKL